MSTDNELAEILHDLAEAGPPPDESSAWRAVADRIHGEGRGRTRLRLLGVATAAVAAAVVVAVLSIGDDPGQRVDTGPAAPGEPGAPGEETTDTSLGPEEDAARQVAVDAARRAREAAARGHSDDPTVLVSDDHQSLLVVDVATGEVVATPVTVPEGEFLVSPTLAPDGLVYYVHLGTVRVVPWNGSEAPRPVLTESAGYASVAASPDGATLAVGDYDLSSDPLMLRGAIGLLHVASGDYRRLAWPEGDPRGDMTQPQGLSYSPDGSQLAFVNVHDTDGTEGFEAYVIDADAASLAEAELLEGEVWDVVFGAHGGVLALVGDTVDTARPRYLLGGPEVGVPDIGGVRDLSSTAATILARTDDRLLRYDFEADDWVDTGFR